MSRPPLPPEQRAALTVGVRLTQAEKALVDALTSPRADGSPARWGSASELLRGLLHREAQAQGLEAAAPGSPGAASAGAGAAHDPDSIPASGGAPVASVSPPPGAPGVFPAGAFPAGEALPPAGAYPAGGPQVAGPAIAPPGQAGAAPGAYPAYPAYPPGGLPPTLGGGLLPPGTLLLVWPPGWPLPVAPPVAVPGAPAAAPARPGSAPPARPGSAPGARSASVYAPDAGSTPAPAPVGDLSRPGPSAELSALVEHDALWSDSASPDGRTVPPTPAPGAVADRRPSALPPPARPMPAPERMVARFEAILLRSPDLLAKDVAQAAGLSPQDISTFRQGRHITDEKRARLWAWMLSHSSVE